jgi:signal transduction histidine kinase
MKLRTRMAVTLIALAVPLFAATEWLWLHLEERATIASVAQLARARMQSGGRAACERAPETFGNPPPRRAQSGDEKRSREGRARWDIHAYRADFTSANPTAPLFPSDLRSAIESGAREAGSMAVYDEHRTITVAVDLNSGSEPCEFVLAVCEDDPEPAGLLDHVTYNVLIVGGFAAAVLLATGPVGRRLRRLTASIRRSAEDRYQGEIAVAGSDEVADLARALDSARGEILAHIDEIRSRERALRDFVENTTHDVMIPLTVLQGQIVALRETLIRREPVSRAKVQELLEELHYLVSLVQNLGAAAQLEAGEPTKRRDAFAWNPVVERVVLRHATIAQEKGVELDFAVPEHPVIAEGDVTMVEQALSNVVHNAVKYNESGGHVAVLLDDTPERFSVRVFDDGPGVSDEERERLSDRSFRTGAARERHPGGTGLGLSIAKAVADWHGFELALRRSFAGGLEVEIEGPIAASAETA